MFGPRGVAAFQIFYVSHFVSCGLAVKAVVKVDFFERAEDSANLVGKRATSASIGAACAAAVMKVRIPRNWPRAWPGASVARSATSIFDHATAELIEREDRAGDREILSPNIGARRSCTIC